MKTVPIAALGPLRPFVLALAQLREIEPAGHSAPRMSPESGRARLSSFISLRKAPHRPDPMRGRRGQRMRSNERPQRAKTRKSLYALRLTPHKVG